VPQLRLRIITVKPSDRKEKVMKRTLSFILSIILILSFVSCGGEMPEKTPEPATPEESDTPTAGTAETVKKTDIPFESGTCVPCYQFIDYENGEKEKVTVIQETGMLDGYYEQLWAEFNSMTDLVLKMFPQESTPQDTMLYAMRYVRVISQSLKDMERYDNNTFFKDNVLIMIDFVSGGGIDDIAIRDVYVKEENGKTELVIDAVKIIDRGGFGADAESVYSTYVAIPKNIGVDFENGVTVNWEEITDTYYLTYWQ